MNLIWHVLSKRERRHFFNNVVRHGVGWILLLLFFNISLRNQWMLFKKSHFLTETLISFIFCYSIIMIFYHYFSYINEMFIPLPKKKKRKKKNTLHLSSKELVCVSSCVLFVILHSLVLLLFVFFYFLLFFMILHCYLKVIFHLYYKAWEFVDWFRVIIWSIMACYQTFFCQNFQYLLFPISYNAGVDQVKQQTAWLVAS